MDNRVVTVSREFGSGGRTIGRQLAAKLNIPCYDYELIDKVAEESGFARSYIAEHGEYAAYGSRIGNALLSGHFVNGVANQDFLWIAQRKVITDLAEQGPCVIIGRCADYILKDNPNLLKVFIHSDLDSRAERIVKLYGESDVAPLKRLKDKDKRRAAYYRYYTDMEWGVAKNYDISLDSGRLGIDKCVELLAQLY